MFTHFGNSFSFPWAHQVYNAEQVCCKQVYGGSINIVGVGYLIEHAFLKINCDCMSRVGEYVKEITFRSYREYDDNIFMFIVFPNWNEIDLPLLPYLDSMHIVTWDAQRVLKRDFLALVNSIRTSKNPNPWLISGSNLATKTIADGIKSVSNWELKVIYIQEDNSAE